MGKKPEKSNSKFNWVPLLILLTLAIFTVIIIGPSKVFSLVEQGSGGSLPAMQTATLLRPSPTLVPTRTPLPESYSDIPHDFFENERETDGVILGGTVLVLLILLCTFISKRNNSK